MTRSPALARNAARPCGTIRWTRQSPHRTGAPLPTESAIPSRLAAASRWLLLASLLACVAGLAWSVAAAPCSKVGAVLLVGAFALGVLAAAALIVRAFFTHPVRSILMVFPIILICALEYFVNYTFTPLLCHG